MQFLYWLETHRTPFMDTFMSLVTHLGSETLFMVIAITVGSSGWKPFVRMRMP